MESPWVIVPNQHLRGIPLNLLSSKTKVIDISGNPSITSLSDLPSLPKLEKLTCRDTGISSFKYVNDQPNLYSLDLRESPISSYKYFNAMASIVFGRQLTIINGAFISATDESVRDSIGPMIRSKLIRGLILLETNPIILYDPERDKQITINLPKGENLLVPKEEPSPEDALIDAVMDHLDPNFTENFDEKPQKFSEMVEKYQKHVQTYIQLRAKARRRNVVFAEGKLLPFCTENRK